MMLTLEGGEIESIITKSQICYILHVRIPIMIRKSRKVKM